MMHLRLNPLHMNLAMLNHFNINRNILKLKQYNSGLNKKKREFSIVYRRRRIIKLVKHVPVLFTIYE